MIRQVVIALVKLENLKAIHNLLKPFRRRLQVVYALVKLENLKVIHNNMKKEKVTADAATFMYLAFVL